MIKVCEKGHVTGRKVCPLCNSKTRAERVRAVDPPQFTEEAWTATCERALRLIERAQGRLKLLREKPYFRGWRERHREKIAAREKARLEAKARKAAA